LFLWRLDLSGRRKAHVLWALCGVALAWRCILLLVIHAAPYRVTYGTDTRLDSILFGCALAVHRNPALDPKTYGSERLWKRVVVPLSLVLLLVSIAIPNPTFRETIRYSVQGISLYPIFIAAIRWPQWGVFRILNLRPVRFVGTLSYSLYLVHYVALSFVRAQVPLPHLLIAPAALLIAFGAAWLIWWTVERPCARLRERLASLPTASVRVSAGS
jgi:peptidoglycan/LPS O-acetylase OafA/YrhL